MRKKILFVHHGSAFGGAPISLLYTAMGLKKKRDFDIYIALARPSKELRTLYTDQGFTTIDAPELTVWHHSAVAYMPIYSLHTWKHLAHVAFGWRASKRKLIDIVNTIAPDVVHLNSMPLTSCGEALFEKNVPFIWHVREPAKPRSGFRFNFINQRLLSANELIFISNADKRSWLRKGQSKGVVIHNFVDFEKLDSAIMPSVSIGGTSLTGRRVLIYVGGLNYVKGVFVLIETIRRLVVKYPNLLVLMPGAKKEETDHNQAHITSKNTVRKGTQRDVYELIEKYNISQNILMLPFNPDITSLMLASEFLLFPSVRPHFARPVIESNALGIPAIASNFEGMEELLDDNNTGLLVEPRSAKDLVDKCIMLLDNPKLRNDMGRRAKIKAIKDFSLESQVDKILEVYDRVLTK